MDTSLRMAPCRQRDRQIDKEYRKELGGGKQGLKKVVKSKGTRGRFCDNKEPVVRVPLTSETKKNMKGGERMDDRHNKERRPI